MLNKRTLRLLALSALVPRNRIRRSPAIPLTRQYQENCNHGQAL